MDFKKLKNNINNCNTLANATIPDDKVFIRKLKKADKLSNVDFKTHTELGKEMNESYFSNKCDYFRKMNSVSINSYGLEDRKSVINIYKAKFNVSPNYKKSAVLFKITEDSGMTEYTPSISDNYHHSLYKEDNFTTDSGIEVIDIIDLRKECCQ